MSTAYGSTRSPVSIPAWAPNYATGGTGMTAIDMHREDEQLRGLNIRQAPQPFTGYHMSADPVENFDGAGATGSGTAGACTGSASGEAGGAFALLNLLGIVFLILLVAQEGGATQALSAAAPCPATHGTWLSGKRVAFSRRTL
ncbi:MAG: hypothetical protein HY716_09560 [Planctomycetes bacterium]|nr:hypothetical protein [Planctomycetota bacterium]